MATVLHGRGSWDDKAGVATLIWLVEALRDTGIRLAGDLIVESVIEEEISGNGDARVHRAWLSR